MSGVITWFHRYWKLGPKSGGGMPTYTIDRSEWTNINWSLFIVAMAIPPQTSDWHSYGHTSVQVKISFEPTKFWGLKCSQLPVPLLPSHLPTVQVEAAYKVGLWGQSTRIYLPPSPPLPSHLSSPPSPLPPPHFFYSVLNCKLQRQLVVLFPWQLMCVTFCWIGSLFC